jgi:glycogen debranching enzyme
MLEELADSSADHYIYTTTPRADERTRVLKHGDTFAVFNHLGDFGRMGRREFGLFHQDTRFLSTFKMRLSGEPLLLLNSAVRKDNVLLAVDLTNPDIERVGELAIPSGILHVHRSQVLWDATCYAQVRIHNYGEETVQFPLQLAFEADYADIFEVRGEIRDRRGYLQPVHVENDNLVFSYDGLDDRHRRTRIRFSPRPDSLSDLTAEYDVELAPQEAVQFEWTMECEISNGDEGTAQIRADGLSNGSLDYDAATERATGALQSMQENEPQLSTSNEQFDGWLTRSLADLRMLSSETPHGPYPYAGVPWFSTPFGRDGILTAFQCLWYAPHVTRGVLGYLAATQAESENAERDAEPGKILHETRAGEMATLGEVPFDRYYGSVDVTPLFIMLAGAYYDRTGDRAFIQDLWPHVERALSWIEKYGDVDGDGFVEYMRCSEDGLIHQGWKDSNDSVFHDDGSAAEGPIALCEVQAYTYAAYRGGARLARVLDQHEQAETLRRRARQLANQFEDAFWLDDLSTYALALDGDNQPCRVRTSNAGHCLFAGIASEAHAEQVAETLMSEPSYTGWGLRTVASTEARYNPISYHNGSVWPHDNAIVAAGLGRYGHRKAAAKIMEGLFDASQYLDLHRLPELFCGFSRRSDEGPTLYPQACVPQAWAAATPLMCLEACLGLEVNGAECEIRFHDPYLPSFLDQIQIHDLQVGDSTVDLLISRYERDVGVRLTRREGEVQLAVLK